MTFNLLLLGFACAFMGCVLTIPLITKLAAWVGAIDTPDHFRRIHKVSIPRMGGAGVAFGILLAVPVVGCREPFQAWSGFENWWAEIVYVGFAALLVLIVGILDDTQGLSPRLKILGQASAVLVLYLGGIRIERLDFFGITIPATAPFALNLPGLNSPFIVDLPSLTLSMLWFLACMNIWNLIDGMDGLASGVGLIVSSTLMLVAVHQGNLGSAVLAAVLTGSLAGFLLYNWHPACIFLGDSGSLLLGLLLGVIGVLNDHKGTHGVSILFPVVAMGLPISDTSMAIFRRWVRDLPLSSADRRHIHHLLIGLGLTTRQAALILYFFTAGLCGVVMMGVAWRNDLLVLILGLLGCFAFLLVLTSRRDELTQLLSDLRSRRRRRRLERNSTRSTWEWVQRIELCDSLTDVTQALQHGATQLGAERLNLRAEVRSQVLSPFDEVSAYSLGSGNWARFLIENTPDLKLELLVKSSQEDGSDSDILFRSIHKLAEVAAIRLRYLAGIPCLVDHQEQTKICPPSPVSISEQNPELALVPSLPFKDRVHPSLPSG